MAFRGPTACLRRALRRATRCAAAGDLQAAEAGLRQAAAANDDPAFRAACYRGLARLCLRSGRPASAGVWQQQAIAAAIEAGDVAAADLRLAADVAAEAGDGATARCWEQWLSRDAAPGLSESLYEAAKFRAAVGDWSTAEVLARAAARRDDSPADRPSRLAEAAAVLARLTRAPGPFRTGG